MGANRREEGSLLGGLGYMLDGDGRCRLKVSLRGRSLVDQGHLLVIILFNGMNISVFEQLYQKGLVSEDSLNKIRYYEKEKNISVHWELKTLLYAGILLLTTGLGIVIYENIDTIGHMAIVLFIGLASASCFIYCFRKGSGYKVDKVTSPNVWFDYILLLGCLLMITSVGYLQFQYEIFGNRWGMATFIPMVILFFCAYYFDHLGVLSLAITTLAAWVGITLTPKHILESEDFSTPQIIYSGILLGTILIVVALFSISKNIKAHFGFTYKNFGVHMLFISSLAAIIQFDQYYLLWFLLLVAVAAYEFSAAVKERSFYFLVVSTIYFYTGMSYVIIRSLFKLSSGEGNIYLTLLYLIGSAIGLVLFLIYFNKRLKQHAGIQPSNTA